MWVRTKNVQKLFPAVKFTHVFIGQQFMYLHYLLAIAAKCGEPEPGQITSIAVINCCNLVL